VPIATLVNFNDSILEEYFNKDKDGASTKPSSSGSARPKSGKRPKSAKKKKLPEH